MATGQEVRWNIYSTHAFDYTITSYIEWAEQPCTLVAATVCDTLNYNVPPFYCANNLGNNSSSDLFLDYLKYHSERFALLISRHFSDIQPCCAAAIVETFKSFIEKADISHIISSGDRTPFYRVKIGISYLDEETRAIRESFEEATVLPEPASVDSVNALLASQDGRLNESWSDRCCVICLDEIKTPLEMPCCHVFHEGCLLEWLKTSHVCPLCRYEMPVEPAIT